MRTLSLNTLPALAWGTGLQSHRSESEALALVSSPWTSWVRDRAHLSVLGGWVLRQCLASLSLSVCVTLSTSLLWIPVLVPYKIEKSCCFSELCKDYRLCSLSTEWRAWHNWGPNNVTSIWSLYVCYLY